MAKCSVFSSSYYSSKKDLENSKNNLHRLGFDEVEFFSSNKKYQGMWAGHPSERLNLFYRCWNSNSKIIFATRGGSGVSHFISRIDKSKLKGKKLFCGYSDLTLLLLFLNQKLGLISLHGPNAMKKLDLKSFNALKSAIEMKNYGILFNERSVLVNSEKNIEGIMIGGNLERLVQYLINNKIDFRDKIVFLEDVNMTKERLFDCFFYLKNYPLFKPRAILVGGLGKKIDGNFKLFLSNLFRETPLIIGLPFGHKTPNITIPIGAKGVINFKDKRITFIFPKEKFN